MKWPDLDRQLYEEGLRVIGAFHPEKSDWFEGAQTAVLVGPAEPDFWRHFRKQPEFGDGQPDSMDRFSKRVLNRIAKDAGGHAYFPSDGPPYPPFIRWALNCGTYQSPVGLLVNQDAGLFASFRGLLVLPEIWDLPARTPRPCDNCANQPCETACPIGALTSDGYDVEACKSYLRSPQGAACMSGCQVRLSCPSSQNLGRLPEQSEFHMKAFLSE